MIQVFHKGGAFYAPPFLFLRSSLIAVKEGGFGGVFGAGWGKIRGKRGKAVFLE